MAKQTKKRKLPLRKCVVTGEMVPKGQLVRIVKTKDQEVFLDPTGRQNGRGAYITLDPEVALLAKKKRSFDQAFGMKISDDFYDEVYRYIDHQKARQELI